MSSRSWLGSLALIAFLGSSAAYAGPVASVLDQDFGRVRVENAPAAKLVKSLTFNIQNTGDMTLTIMDVTVNGMQSGDFAITAKPAANTDVGPGDAVPVTVELDPSDFGTRSTTLRVTSNAPQATATLTGIGASAVIAAVDLDFGIVAPGASSTQDVAVKNSITTNPGRTRSSP
jgi:hypothetical protein